MVRTSFPWGQHDLPQRYSKKRGSRANPQFAGTAAREQAHTRGWRRQPKDMQRTVAAMQRSAAAHPPQMQFRIVR